MEHPALFTGMLVYCSESAILNRTPCTNYRNIVLQSAVPWIGTKLEWQTNMLNVAGLQQKHNNNWEYFQKLYQKKKRFKTWNLNTDIIH